MNYLDITLIGYKSTTDFPQHIYREYKKAIENHFSLKEFFDGCNNAVHSFVSLFEEQNSRRIEMYYKAIDVIENDANRSEEQKAIDIGRVEKEIESININDIGMPLLTLSKNRLTGHLWFSDVIAMQKGLIDAREIAVNEVEKGLSTPKNVTIDFKGVYNKEVTEERKAKLYADLAEIESIPDKIAFLKNEKLTYQQNIPFETFEASGILTANGFGNGGPLYFDRFIDLEIEKLQNLLVSVKQKVDFQSIFNPNNNSFNTCIELLEDLEITVNGVCRLTIGKASPLIGAIAAMKDTLNFFKQDFTDMELLSFFNRHLDTDYKTFARRGKLFESNYDDAKNFIKDYFKK